MDNYLIIQYLIKMLEESDRRNRRNQRIILALMIVQTLFLIA